MDRGATEGSIVMIEPTMGLPQRCKALGLDVRPLVRGVYRLRVRLAAQRAAEIDLAFPSGAELAAAARRFDWATFSGGLWFGNAGLVRRRWVLTAAELRDVLDAAERVRDLTAAAQKVPGISESDVATAADVLSVIAESDALRWATHASRGA